MSKLPYGAGSVIYNPRNRFSPYTARRYRGNDSNGNPLYITMGSYATRDEAEQILLENQFLSSADIRRRYMSLEDVFSSFLRNNRQYYADNTVKCFSYAFHLIESAHKTQYKDITCRDMKHYIDACENYSQRVWVKRLFTKLDQEAKLLNVPIQSEAQYLPRMLIKDGDIQHRPRRCSFTDAEIEKILEHRNDLYMDIVLVLCYTGLRQGELRNLKKEKVDVKNQFFTAGSKTEAGRNRRIPIHPNISPFIARWMESQGPYLIPWHDGRPISSTTLDRFFKRALEPLGLSSRVPHECRHTFISKLEQQGVNDNLIRKLAGHRITDSTVRVYYHPTDEELMGAVLKLWK